MPTLYPPAPSSVPTELTQPDNAYRLRVVAMIGGLFVFLLVYLLLLVLSGWVAYWLLTLPIPDIRGRGILAFLVLKFGGALAMLLVWLFLFKGLFKGQRVERSNYLPLQEADYPELFAFIRQVYQDAGAPPPHRVYVSPDVNAALVYDTSLLNLIVPPRKDLLIGLGLVNVVNLSEFKAVLAHEFGHFSQRSVGLSNYLYVANRVISDVIFRHDALDRFVDAWSRIDLVISFPAWGLKLLLWIVRKILGSIYQALNLLHLSLGRQMEYNADNVAVRVAGSDAIVHALSRLEFASEALADAAQSLEAAADHGLFTDDLFYHQTQAAHRLRRLRKNERLGLPPELPADPTQTVRVFEEVSDGIPEKYRTHPTDDMRERNAKRIYIRSVIDDRSPWLLFGRREELTRSVTELFYKHHLNRSEPYTPRPASEVQQFIDAEHAENTYDPRYHGLYDDRFINPGDLQDLRDNPNTTEELAAWLANWPPADLEQRVKAYQERKGEYQLLQGLQSGELSLKNKSFPFRGQQCTMRDVDRLFQMVDQELDADIAQFQQLDRAVYLAHWSLARQLDAWEQSVHRREVEFLERYRFHMTLQKLFSTIMAEQSRTQAILNVLGQNSQLSAEDFQQIRDALQNVRQAVLDSLQEAQAVPTPSLTNVPAGSSLHSLIVDRSDTELPALTGNSISGEWIGKLLTRLDGVLRRLRRVHFKSLGTLLAFQEKMAKDWQAVTASVPQSV